MWIGWSRHVVHLTLQVLHRMTSSTFRDTDFVVGFGMHIWLLQNFQLFSILLVLVLLFHMYFGNNDAINFYLFEHMFFFNRKTFAIIAVADRQKSFIFSFFLVKKKKSLSIEMIIFVIIISAIWKLWLKLMSIFN